MPRANHNKRKTHCLYGHPLVGENIYLPPSGHRECRICREARRPQRRTPLYKTHCKYGHEFSFENTKFGTDSSGQVKRTCIECQRRRWKLKNQNGNLTRPVVERVFEAAHEGRTLTEIDGKVVNVQRLKVFCREHPKAGKSLLATFEKNGLAARQRSRRRVAAPAVMRDNGTYTMEAIRHACANVWEPIRNDVMADMILAASEGKFHPKDARAHVDFYVKRYNAANRHDVSSRWGNLSLDQPIGDDDTGSFYEIIRDDQRLWG